MLTFSFYEVYEEREKRQENAVKEISSNSVIMEKTCSEGIPQLLKMSVFMSVGFISCDRSIIISLFIFRSLNCCYSKCLWALLRLDSDEQNVAVMNI